MTSNGASGQLEVRSKVRRYEKMMRCTEPRGALSKKIKIKNYSRSSARISTAALVIRDRIAQCLSFVASAKLPCLPAMQGILVADEV
jgi:hypothetical protein